MPLPQAAGKMPEQISKLFGQAVRFRRHVLGLSQEELAWRAGLNRTYVTEVEGGCRNLSLSTLERLAEALQTALFVMFRDIDKGYGQLALAEPVEPGGTDILLVEDNPRDVEMALRALRRARLANTVHVARDGVEAIDFLFCTGRHAARKPEDRPQLVLLDLNLPRVDGMEVLRRLKSHVLTRAIPVIVLTVSKESNDFAEASRLGAEGFIVKPVDFQRLSEVTPSLEFSWMLHRLPSLPAR